jgi:hypothetical protein
VRERLIHALEQGATYEAAATYAGIHVSTLHRWIARADDPDSDSAYRELRNAVERARAKLQTDLLECVLETVRGGALIKETTRTFPNGDELTERQYAPPDGRLGLELLSRLWPRDFARRNALEVTGADGGPIQIASAEKLAAIAATVKDALNKSELVDAEVVDEQPRAIGQAA